MTKFFYSDEMKFLHIFYFIILSLSINTSALALTNFYVGAYEGYGYHFGLIDHDGQSARARLIFGMQSCHKNNFNYGMETGIQNGVIGALTVSSIVYTTLGNLPLQVTIKPTIDFLFTVKTPPLLKPHIFLITKMGIAFRQLQFDTRDTIPDIRRINPELQLGLGFPITKHFSIMTIYQRIFSKTHANVYLTSPETAKVTTIPMEETGFIGIEYKF